ncbi:MAG: HAD family hydrolase [Promethearchaeota archaeon]|nr:MAG: HAD family hydrolase [Candidatus Lokiarchaeota archaeon]
MISFKHKKVIVFDLDGTIVRLPVNWGHLKKLLTKRFKDVYNETCEFVHITACLDQVVDKDDEAELQNFFNMLEDYEMKTINENENVKETIFFINNLNMFNVPNDIKLAVFSLNTRKTIIESLKLAGIYEKIDYIVGREDLRKWKPNPEGLLKIRDHYDVKKEEMIYIGDLEKDVITGKNAGIEAYLIDEIINLVNEKRLETT